MSGYEFVSCRSAKDERLPAGTIATSYNIIIYPWKDLAFRIAPTLVGASPPSAVVALLHCRRLVACSSVILGEVLGSSHLSGSTCFITIPYCTVTTVKTQR